MQDQDTGPRPPEPPSQQPETVFTELIDRLEATRNEHGGVTFGKRNEEYFGDMRAVVLPAPAIEDEGKKKTYVAATAGGPRGIVFEREGKASAEDLNTDRVENLLQQELMLGEQEGGVVESVRGLRLGYFAPSNDGEEVVIPIRDGGSLRFHREESNMYLTDVDADIVTKAYEASKAKRAEPPKSVQSTETVQQGVRAANALMQRLGPKPQ